MFFGIILGLVFVIPLAFHLGFREGFKKALNAYVYMDFRIMLEGKINQKVLRDLWHGMDGPTEDSFEGLARHLDSLGEEEE